jgi:hypothetical protein
MRMPNKNEDECLAESESLAEAQSSLRHAFKHVYGFILQGVKGDKAAADAIFEDYLAGKLSERLLSISRRCVSADQARSSKPKYAAEFAALAPDVILSANVVGIAQAPAKERREVRARVEA